MLDLLFLHPPASFLKGDRPFAGVFPAEVGTDSWFRHAPLGLNSMAQALRSAGREARILNLAKLLSEAQRKDRPIDIDRELASRPARVFGIGLHWAVHTPGALELASIVRRLHPESVIVMGGLTAGFFTEEVLTLAPQVDYVLQGECEDAVVALLDELDRPRFDPSRVPNLAYRHDGGVVKNKIVVPVPRAVDYTDVSLYEPGQAPDAFVIPILRGCIEDCAFCGGARSAYRDWFGRPVVSALPEDAIVDGLTRAAEGGLRTALLAGDLRGLGRRRAMRLLDRLAALELPLVLQNELFFMADREYIEAFTRATRNGGLRLTLSPESASRKVRAIVSRGKDYSNEQIKDLARIHQDLGAMFLLCMFFALPHQTADQVRRDSDFIAEVLEIAPTSTGFMQEPMLFVDPGSPIYRDPGHFGYTIHARTLSDLKTHLTRPYWTGAIGFETQWMSRRELIESVFSVFERTTELHYRHAHADASQFLFTRGAVAAHRAVVTALEQEGDLYVTGEGADALVDRLIEEHVPEVHRGDNNLKDYAGHEAARRGGRLMHALFPGTTDLLLGRAADPTELAAAFEAGADALDTLLELRHPMTELPRSIARPLRAIADRVTPPLPPRVVVDLAAFELACCRLATPSSRAPMEQIAAGIHRTQPMDDFVTGIEEMHDEMQRPPLDRGLSETSPSSLREPDGGTALEPALRTHSLRADDRVRLQPQAAILTTRYPVHQLAQTDLGDVLEREGTFVIAVSRGGVALYEQEAATLLQALCKGPRQPTRAIPGDPGPRGLRLLEVFLNRLADRGVIESAG